jgi:hypothetical protein
MPEVEEHPSLALPVGRLELPEQAYLGGQTGSCLTTPVRFARNENPTPVIVKIPIWKGKEEQEASRRTLMKNEHLRPGIPLGYPDDIQEYLLIGSALEPLRIMIQVVAVSMNDEYERVRRWACVFLRF